MTQKITPFLWFDDNVEEAMNFYVSIFKNSEVLSINRYGDAGPGTEGTVVTTSFRLDGQEFMGLNGGPVFSFTPAVSFFVGCKSENEVDVLWEKLVQGGTVLMPLDKYPFSDKFGWIEDRFGVSWQLILTGETQSITPFLMFVGEQYGRAEEAINYYTSLFEHSSIDQITRDSSGGEEPGGAVVNARFILGGQEFIAMESNGEHAFTFTEATSFFIDCESQEEVDRLWEKLSEGGETSQCGWLKDKFGLSWQVIPSVLVEMLQDKDRERANRVMQAMLQMTKIDIARLKQAYEQA